MPNENEEGSNPTGNAPDGKVGGDAEEAMAHVQVVCIIAISNATFLLLHLWGLKVFPVLAAHYKNWSLLAHAGDALIILGLLLLCVFYIFDLLYLRPFLWVLFFVAALLNGVQTPWAPPVFVFLLMLGLLMQLRGSYRNVDRSHLMLSAGLTFLVCGVLILVGWVHIYFGEVNLPILEHVRASVREMSQSQDAKVVYDYFGVDHTTDCMRNGPSPLRLTEAVARRDAACAEANNVIVITWAIPFSTACVDVVFGLFVLGTGLYFRTKAGDPTEGELQQLARVFFLVSTLLWSGLYVSTYTLQVSVSLTMPLLGSLFVAAVAALKWVFVEKCAMQDLRDPKARCGCPLVEAFFKVKDSSWFKAMAVGSFFVPMFMLLEYLRELRRPGPGRKTQPRGPNTFCSFTGDDQARFLYMLAMAWEPTEILVCICYLGELFFVLQVLGTKFTYVFLAWMNEVLSDQNLLYAMAIAFVVGLFMLLLPPVPGVPVYIFCGIVVAKQGKEELSFAGGCGAAVLLSLVLKLFACTIQYYIGVCLGHWGSVQRFIGVGTPTTTSIMRILNCRLSLSKVAILVGGPDWPTSVACGILGINLGWMLVGTLPCLFTASPCVLAGAFLADEGKGKGDKVHEFLGSLFTLLAAVVQVGSLLWATNAINTELTQVPPDAADPAGGAAYEKVSNQSDGEQDTDDSENDTGKADAWKNLSIPEKVILVVAASLMLFTGYAFAILGDVLFENFSVSGKIGDDVDEFGLGGNPLAIVKPKGWIAISLWGLGLLLHLVFYGWTHHEARAIH